MKLRATRLSYTIDPKAFSLFVVDQSDPERSFDVVMNSTDITISKQNIFVMHEPHGIQDSAWGRATVVAAAQKRLEAILGNLDKAPEQIGSMMQIVQNIVNQLDHSQQNWTAYQNDGLAKAYYEACAQLRNSLLYAKNAGIHVERIIDETSYPPLENPTDPAKLELSIAVQHMKKQIEDSLESVRATLTTETDKLSKNVKARTEDISLVATAAQNKASEAFNMAEHIETKVINDLLSEEGALKQKTKKLEQEVETILSNVKNYQEEKLTEIEALLEKSGKTERQLARLTQKEAADAMTNQFKHAAVEAGESAINWTGAFFIVGGIAVGCIIWLINNPPTVALTGEMGWLAIFGRLSLTAAMAYMLGYSGLQATRQRNAKLYFRRMGIEMIALDAYLSPYDDETALGIKSELMKAYFGKVDAPGYQKEGDLPSIDILGRVTEVIARRKAKEAPKDEEDKTGAEALAKKLLEKGGVDAVDLALKLLTLEDKKDTSPKDDKPS